MAALVVGICMTGDSMILAENWPQWRGPHGNGVCSDSNLPTEWSKEKNVAWKVPLPGHAGSTPCVWEDRIFLTTADDSDLLLLCVSTEGKELWRQKVGTGNKVARGDEGNSASASPSTDGKHVWVFFGTGVLACYDFDGHEVWTADLQQRYGKFEIQFGMTSTPILYGDHLYMQLIHGNMRSDYTVGKVIKLEKETGKEVWAVDRKCDPIAENKHSYASPVLYDDGDRQQLITHGADHTIAFDLDSGKEVWRVGGLNGPSQYNDKFDRTLRFVSSPVATDGVVVIPTAKGGPTLLVHPAKAKGDITGSSEAVGWVNDKTPDVPCPLVVDGLAYFCRKDGKVFCCDVATGEEFYYERTHGAQHRASPFYANGFIYLTARDGHVTVIKAGKKFEVVANNELGESLTASPACADGVLYLRTFEHLYAIKNQ